MQVSFSKQGCFVTFTRSRTPNYWRAVKSYIIEASEVPLQNIQSNPVPEEPERWISNKQPHALVHFPILVIHNGQWLSKARVDGLGGAKGVGWRRQISLAAGGWNEVLQKQGCRDIP